MEGQREKTELRNQRPFLKTIMPYQARPDSGVDAGKRDLVISENGSWGDLRRDGDHLPEPIPN